MLRDATHGSVLPSASKLLAPVVTRWSVFPAVVPGGAGSLLPPFLLSRLNGAWSAPEEVVPEAGLAEAAHPEPAIPDAVVPEATDAEAGFADAAVPEVAFMEPFLTEPASTDPVLTEPAIPEPVLADPVLTESVIAEPVVADPALTEPPVTEPPFTDPALTEPAAAEPVFTDAVPTEPAAREPVSTEEPATPIEAADPGLTVEEPLGQAEKGEETGGEFPPDAFFIPEEMERVTSGADAASAETVPVYRVLKASMLDQPPGGRVNAAAATLAERLERFARLLRENGPAVLPGALTSGDRLDLLLAGLLTGYLVANDD